jgi:hypothetical protein
MIIWDIKIRNNHATAHTWIICYAVYKNKWFDEWEKKGKKLSKAEKETHNATIDDYSNDLYIIEEICSTTGNQEMNRFPFLYMFDDYVRPLEKVFPRPDTKNKDFPKSVEEAFPVKGNDDKEALRAVLFLVLQACVLSRCEKYDTDLTNLWAAYNGFLKTETDAKPLQPYHKYNHMMHNVINMMVGFTGEKVSNGNIMDMANAYIMMHNMIICISPILYIDIQSFGRWEELVRCYPVRKTTAYLCVGNGRVSYRWYLSISLFFALSYKVMSNFKDEIYQHESKRQEKGPATGAKQDDTVVARVHLFRGYVLNMGEIFEKLCIEKSKDEYVKAVKLVPLFMYCFIKVRLPKQGNQIYYPDQKDHHKEQPKEGEEEEEEGNMRYRMKKVEMKVKYMNTAMSSVLSEEMIAIMNTPIIINPPYGEEDEHVDSKAKASSKKKSTIQNKKETSIYDGYFTSDSDNNDEAGDDNNDDDDADYDDDDDDDDDGYHDSNYDGEASKKRKHIPTGDNEDDTSGKQGPKVAKTDHVGKPEEHVEDSTVKEDVEEEETKGGADEPVTDTRGEEADTGTPQSSSKKEPPSLNL